MCREARTRARCRVRTQPSRPQRRSRGFVRHAQAAAGAPHGSPQDRSNPRCAAPPCRHGAPCARPGRRLPTSRRAASVCCAATAALTASAGRSNAAKRPSPVVLKTRPPWAGTGVHSGFRSCSCSASCIAVAMVEPAQAGSFDVGEQERYDVGKATAGRRCSRVRRISAQLPRYAHRAVHFQPRCASLANTRGLDEAVGCHAAPGIGDVTPRETIRRVANATSDERRETIVQPRASRVFSVVHSEDRGSQ